MASNKGIEAVLGRKLFRLNFTAWESESPVPSSCLKQAIASPSCAGKVRNLPCPAHRASRLLFFPRFYCVASRLEGPAEGLAARPPFSHAQYPIFPVPGSVAKDGNTRR